MLSDGIAFTVGLISNSRSPPPAENKSVPMTNPVYGLPMNKGEMAKNINPAATKTWAVVRNGLYPWWSTAWLNEISTMTCVMKLISTSSPSWPKLSENCSLRGMNKTGVRLITVACTRNPR